MPDIIAILIGMVLAAGVLWWASVELTYLIDAIERWRGE
jgi:hypothetical protein